MKPFLSKFILVLWSWFIAARLFGAATTGGNVFPPAGAGVGNAAVDAGANITVAQTLVSGTNRFLVGVASGSFDPLGAAQSAVTNLVVALGTNNVYVAQGTKNGTNFIGIGVTPQSFDPFGAAASVAAGFVSGTPPGLGLSPSTNFLPAIASPWWHHLASDWSLIRNGSNGCYTVNESGPQVTGAYAANVFRFSPPIGISNMTLSFSASSMASGNSTILFGVLGASDDTTPPVWQLTTNVNPGAWITVSTNFTKMGPQEIYIDLTGANSIILGNILLTFHGTLTNAVFTNSFRRFDVLPRYVKNSIFYRTAIDPASEESEVTFVTSAPVVTLDFALQGYFLPYVCSIYTNGSFYCNTTNYGAFAGQPSSQLWDVYLPTNNAQTVVTVVNSSGAQSQGKPAEGCWLKGIMAGSPYNVNFSRDEPKRRMFAFGDSIFSDNEVIAYLASPVTMQNNIFHLTERLTDIETILNSWSYGSLWTNYLANKAAFISAVVSAHPTDFYSGIGINDWANCGYPGLAGFAGTNDFAAAYLDMLVTLHAVLPSMRIFVQTPIITGWYSGTELNSYSSLYLDSYRQAITNLCLGLSDYVTVIDGRTLLDSTADLLSDSIHPTDLGNSKYALRLCNSLFSYPPMTGLPGIAPISPTLTSTNLLLSMLSPRQYLVTGQNFCLTNLANVNRNAYSAITLTASNSSASVITGFVGNAIHCRFKNSTNTYVVLPAGAEADMMVETRSTAQTNVWFGSQTFAQ
jgi:hypothetical protein